jgi:hypothetical protein
MEQPMQLTHCITSCSSQQRDEIDLMDKAAANLARLDSTKRSAGGLMVQREHRGSAAHRPDVDKNTGCQSMLALPCQGKRRDE